MELFLKVRYKMFRVGIVKSNGQVEGKNFETKQEADDYILSMEEKDGLKNAMILNKETGEKEIIKF